MKKILITLLGLFSIAYGQTIGYLRYDTVKIYTTKAGGRGSLDVTGAVKFTGLLQKSAGTDSVIVRDASGFLGTVSKASIAGSGWGLTGNAGTTAGTNFIGTTDATDFVIKVNNTEVARYLNSSASVEFGEPSTNISSGVFSLTSGNNNTASGDNAVSFGQQNLSSGIYSFSVGLSNISSGEQSFSAGAENVASNYASIALGHKSTASGNGAVAIGDTTHATGINSAAFGVQTYARHYGGFVIGVNNDSTAAASSSTFNTSNRVFQIGIGPSAGTRNNAMTVLFNGNVGIGTLTPAATLHTVGTVRHASLGSASTDTTTYKPLGVSSLGDVIPMTAWTSGGSGANVTLSNLTSPTAINQSLLPGTDNTPDIGSGAKQWRYGIYGTGIAIGAAAAPSAALDIRAADLFLTSSSVDQRFIIGESLVSATECYAISWNRTDNQLVFNEGGAAVSMRLEGDANANLFFADATNDRIGIGDATPASLFTVGSGDLFQVNTSGDLVKLKNVTYSWPAANAAGILTNNGSGTLSWAAAFALTSGNGTTANGTAVDLGGTTTGAINIATAANTFDVDGTGVISLGDVSAAGNSTKQEIDDGSSQITWFANTLFKFRTGAVQMDAYGAGAATFDASGNITSVSDMRLKNLQGMYEVGLKQLMQINPIVYKWNEKSKLETKHDYIGFSAQNVRDALGEKAIGINKDGYYSLQDRAILAAMVNSIKELKELNDKQQEEINNLKSDIRKIKKQ